jgi:hypothetical protein
MFRRRKGVVGGYYSGGVERLWGIHKWYKYHHIPTRPGPRHSPPWRHRIWNTSESLAQLCLANPTATTDRPRRRRERKKGMMGQTCQERRLSIKADGMQRICSWCDNAGFALTLSLSSWWLVASMIVIVTISHPRSRRSRTREATTPHGYPLKAFAPTSDLAGCDELGQWNGALLHASLSCWGDAWYLNLYQRRL